MNKRNLVNYISHSLTVSVRTEAILLDVNSEYYFIEYPTNKLPNPSTFKQDKKIKYTQLSHEDFLSLGAAFISYEHLHTKKPFLHAPSFIIGWCQNEGLSCDILN